MPATHTFSCPLWAMPGEGGWVFATVPSDVTELIRAVPREPRPGFGSLRVNATLGSTTWKTSIFPDSKSHCFVLPVKKAVRSAEGIDPPDVAIVTLEVLD